VVAVVVVDRVIARPTWRRYGILIEPLSATSAPTYTVVAFLPAPGDGQWEIQRSGRMCTLRGAWGSPWEFNPPSRHQPSPNAFSFRSRWTRCFLLGVGAERSV